MKNAELTIIIKKNEQTGMYVGQIEEFPAAVSQGRTIEELKENLLDALKLLLETQKEELRQSYSKEKTIKRKLLF